MNKITALADARSMSVSEYESRRTELRRTYGDNKRQAGVRFEQELCRLFDDSGWTQERLAEEEGKGRTWIVYRLRFGRFLNWLDVTNVTISENHVIQLSEGKFRGFWADTNPKLKEAGRFKQVLEMIGSETIVRVDPKARKAYCEKLLKKFDDGRWHHIDTINKHMGADNEHHLQAILQQGKKGMHGCVLDKRKHGTSFDFKVYGSGRKVDMGVLKTELWPILDELDKEGQSSMARMSPPHVAALANRLRKIIENLAN